MLQIIRNVSPAFHPLRESELQIGFREDTNVKVGPQSAQCTAGTQWRQTTNQSSPAESLSAWQDMQMRCTERSVKLIKHTRYAQQRNTSPETYRRAQPQQQINVADDNLMGDILVQKKRLLKFWSQLSSVKHLKAKLNLEKLYLNLEGGYEKHIKSCFVCRCFASDQFVRFALYSQCFHWGAISDNSVR